MEGASDEQCYHFRRARRPRPLDKGLRLRARDRRGREEVVRLRAQRGRFVDTGPRPAREMRLRVGRHRLSPVQGIARDGRRLRHRRGVEDAQARRRPWPQDGPPRRALPGRAAGARGGHRGACARPRVRGRARSGPSAGRCPRRRRARQAAPVEVPAQARARLRREERRRPAEGSLDEGLLDMGRADRPGRPLVDGHARPLLRVRPSGGRREGGAGGQGEVARASAQVEDDVRRAEVPEGHRRRDGRLDRVRGRRVLAVRQGVGIRRMGRAGALRAL